MGSTRREIFSTLGHGDKKSVSYHSVLMGIGTMESKFYYLSMLLLSFFQKSEVFQKQQTFDEHHHCYSSV